MQSVSVRSIYVIKDPDTNLKAFAKVLYGNITIHGIRVFRSKEDDQLFVGMPKEKNKEGKYFPIVSIEDTDLARQIEEVVLEAYHAKTRQLALIQG